MNDGDGEASRRASAISSAVAFSGGGWKSVFQVSAGDRCGCYKGIRQVAVPRRSNNEGAYLSYTRMNTTKAIDAIYC